MLHTENGEVKKTEGYNQARTRRKFWELSYQCYGPSYSRGVDGEGVPILRQHEREEDDDYKRRVQTAVPICMVGPILRRFNDFVFRKPAITDDQFDEFYADVDGQSTDSEEFMIAGTLEAQIQGVSYILVDGTSNGEEKSQAQAETDGDRVVWRHVTADQVIQWRWFNGQLVEAAFLQMDKQGNDFVVWMNDTEVQRTPVTIKVNDGGLLITVPKDTEGHLILGEVMSHGHASIPLIPIKPNFGLQLSQAAALSEMQKSVARLRSLLDEEIANNTFTQTYVIGESAANVQRLTVGTKEAVFFPNPLTKVDHKGADPAQADSIRRSIDADVQELHRTAGIASDAGEAGPVESGVAKAFKFNDLAAILKSLATAAEQAQRKAEKLTAVVLGIPDDYAPVVYPDEFLMPIYEKELNEVIIAIQSPIPQVLKKQAVNRFVTRNSNLNEEDKLKLEQQIEDMGVLPISLS